MRDRVRFPPVETHYIDSYHVAQTFRIEVALPPRRQSEVGPLPVVYVTDGNLVFRMFREIASILQLMGIHPFPAFILVGIGYPSDSPFAGMALRMRDFTFPWPGWPAISVEEGWRPLFPLEGVLFAKEGTKDYGGADDFQRFIGEELIPFIDRTYATCAGDRTYFGHSGGGGFGLYTLFTQSHLFRNYIISSPGLMFSGELPGGVRYENFEYGLQIARDFLASGKSLEAAKVYMSVGTEEDFQPQYYSDRFRCELTSTVYRLAALLKHAAIPGLELMVEPLTGETHMTVYPTAFIHGVQAVFGMRRIGGVF
jgi:uncharacterized protein